MLARGDLGTNPPYRAWTSTWEAITLARSWRPSARPRQLSHRRKILSIKPASVSPRSFSFPKRVRNFIKQRYFVNIFSEESEQWISNRFSCDWDRQRRSELRDPGRGRGRWHGHQKGKDRFEHQHGQGGIAVSRTPWTGSNTTSATPCRGGGLCKRGGGPLRGHRRDGAIRYCAVGGGVHRSETEPGRFDWDGRAAIPCAGSSTPRIGPAGNRTGLHEMVRRRKEHPIFENLIALI
jgi:hypothetical protein